MKVQSDTKHVDFWVTTYENITHTCRIYEACTNGTHLVTVHGKGAEAVKTVSVGTDTGIPLTHQSESPQKLLGVLPELLHHHSLTQSYRILVLPWGGQTHGSYMVADMGCMAACPTLSKNISVCSNVPALLHCLWSIAGVPCDHLWLVIFTRSTTSWFHLNNRYRKFKINRQKFHSISIMS
jgi:hypothetical protein